MTMTMMATTMGTLLGVAATAAMVVQAAPARADSPVNIDVTDAVSAELVTAAVAKTNGVPASEFSGLESARTYLAYDPDTQTYWAAAGLKPISFRAQVASQDSGSYFIFRKADGGPWAAFFDGYGTGPDSPAGPDAVCRVPVAVQDLWQWPHGACGVP